MARKCTKTFLDFDSNMDVMLYKGLSDIRSQISPQLGKSS